MNRIHQVNLTAPAIRDCATALRQRANALYSLADDALTPSAQKHYREAAGRYERLARFMSEEWTCICEGG